MTIDLTRRTFVKGSVAVSGGLALGGPIQAMAARRANGRGARTVGYGELVPTPEEDTGEVFLELPRGFKYRIISTQADVMSDGNPTPGIFDGMAPSRAGTARRSSSATMRTAPAISRFRSSSRTASGTTPT